MNYDQLLFSDLMLAEVTAREAEPTESDIVKAMTVNEELIALGYTLAPRDIVLLAGSEDIDGFVARIREYIGDVKAEPMYPDFPSQVMAMSEAQFRFHQMIHYLSTYGLETVPGVKVIRGWLPEMVSTEKTEQDDALLDAKVLELIPCADKYIIPYGRILRKTERMDDKERMIIRECAVHLTAEELCGVTVTFKQNLLDVFNAIFTSELDSGRKLNCLHELCQHTGDVWKCMDYALTRAGFHFRTSQKRLIVKLLESYPVQDFRANLILSGKKGERVLLMLKFLDFNEYSRNEAFKRAVADFRSGKLRSWESGAKFMAERRAPEALDIYSERPGMMLRHTTYLMRSGYSSDDIMNRLLPKAAALKTQTIVSLLNHFSRPEKCWEDNARYREAVELAPRLELLLEGRLSANDTPLKGKKVYLDTPEFDLECSSIRVADKSSEGGYIRSGLAYRIPDGVRCIRFFVYWNDTQRVDVDLHGAATDIEGKQINVGWNARFKDGSMVFSGDITHSDAAEYIDIDLETAKGKITVVSTNINLFSGYPTFGEIDECFVGMMAVSKTGEEVQLYDPKNCFFTHYLTGKYRFLHYGFIDVENRVLIFDGMAPKKSADAFYSQYDRSCGFSLRHYLDILLHSQGAAEAADPAEADVTLVMGKPSKETDVSLIDANFFME